MEKWKRLECYSIYLFKMLVQIITVIKENVGYANIINPNRMEYEFGLLAST